MDKLAFTDGMKVLRGSHSPQQQCRYAYRPRKQVRRRGTHSEGKPVEWKDPLVVWLLREPLLPGVVLTEAGGYLHSLADLLPWPE